MVLKMTKPNFLKRVVAVFLLVLICPLGLANLTPEQEVVISFSGLGLSERQAKLNAYENFILKLFNQETFDQLNIKDLKFTQDYLVLTDAIRQVLLENVEYAPPYQNLDLYQGEIKLNRSGLNQVYQFVFARISLDIIDLDTKDRHIALQESIQLAMILYTAYQNNFNEEDRKNLNNVLQRVDYYHLKNTTGLAIFPATIMNMGKLKINNKLVQSNEITLPQGKYHFTFTAPEYFPVSGYFQLEKGELKKIALSLIQKPNEVITVATKNNFFNELSRLQRHILESYGWRMDQNAVFVMEGQFRHHNQELENNFIKRKVTVYFRFGENASQKKDFKPVIKDSSELYTQRYESEFIYSQNDLETLARRQRLFFVKSLLDFLSLFTQQDYYYLYSQE